MSIDTAAYENLVIAVEKYLKHYAMDSMIYAYPQNRKAADRKAMAIALRETRQSKGQAA